MSRATIPAGLQYWFFANIYRKMKKILLRGVNWIGDAVMSMPFIEGLAKALPEAEIILITRSHLAVLYKHNPYIKSVIPIEDKSYSKGWPKAVSDIKKTHAPTAICLPHSFSSALMLYISRVENRYGRACSGRSAFFTHPVYGTIEQYEGHQTDFYLEMLEAITAYKHTDRNPVIYLSDNETNIAKNITDNLKKPILGIFCSAAYGPAKVWPKESFAELGRQYTLKTNGSVVLFGGPADKGINDEIASSIGGDTINIAGKTGLLESVAVMEKCNAVVANDSGPMHLAAASGTRTIGIFGSTNPARTAPRGINASYITKNLSCAPCMARECSLGTYECLKSITPEDILKEIL